MWDDRYRELKKGEIIQEGDEFAHEVGNDIFWMKPKPWNIGTEAPDPSFISHRRYRRLKASD